MLHFFSKNQILKAFICLISLFFSSCSPTETSSEKPVNKNNFTKCKIDNLNNSLSIQKLTKMIENLDYNPPDILTIDSIGGNFFLYLEMAKKINKNRIPVWIGKESKCKNDCSLIYLASPFRISKTKIVYPKYSPTEKKKIDKLPPNAFYPVISDKTVLYFLKSILNKQEYFIVSKSRKNDQLEISQELNIKFKGYKDIQDLNKMCEIIKSKKRI